MEDSLISWERKYHRESDGEAFLFYVAFGEIAQDRPLDSRVYRCAGTPAGFELMAYDKVRHREFIDGFRQGYLWEQLIAENSELARKIEHSPGCVILRGGQKNPETLDYLGDCAGLLTYLLDNGACAIYDPQMFHWWSPQQWRERIFDPASPVPRHHVVILYSQEEELPDLLWVHTRGMRKFGRPDISVRRVGPAYRDAVIDLCERFIEYRAYGAVITEGQSVRMASLPPGGVAHHGGDLDDPDFNNVHVEFVWPEPGLTVNIA
ncbi:MAG: hypothetical protein J2P46_18725 [Zavarzinella sp.]|nr:hypothetical protein [Zavarzinella sp.]